MKEFLLNGQIIRTADVLEGRYPAEKQTPFTEHLFSFIRKWYSDENEFAIKTSGSTGQPSVIRITRQQMLASAGATIKALRLKPGGRALLCMDPEHIGGMMMIVRAITGNLDLIAVQPSANPFSNLSEKYPPDFASMVPYQLKSILEGTDHDRKMLLRLRVLLLGGSPVDPALEKKIKKLNIPVYLGFGMTETVSHIALRRLNGIQVSERYKCLPGIEIRTDTHGRLCVRGEVTRNQWIITNDMVETGPSNTFLWEGRADHVINSGGIKIHPEEVEKRIAAFFRGKSEKINFFVAGLPDTNTGQKVTLIVEGKARKQEWIVELKKYLPPYQNPKEVIFLEKFIYTNTGKVQREATIRAFLP